MRCKHSFFSIDVINVDHKDGSRNHNCIRNLQLLCHECNTKKGFESAKDYYHRNLTEWITAPFDHCRQTRHSLYVSERTNVQDQDLMQPPVQVQIRAPTSEDLQGQAKKKIEDLEAAKTRTATMRVNDKCEKPFNKFLNELLDNGSAYSYDEYANAGAHQFECSKQTVQRYLDKRLDLPDCNPINGDLTIRKYHNKECVTFKDPERWYFKEK